MALFLAVAVGLIAWPLISYTYPRLFPQIFFDTPHAHLDRGDIITPQLSTFIEQVLALENITGLSVAVVLKSREPELHSWGYRTEDGDKVTPETLFHMASVSKAFCATALGLLMEDFANGNNATALPPGLTELTWHTRLRDLLPDWQLMDEWASERANLQDILSHVSGIPGHDASYGPLDSPQDMIMRLKYLRPAFELRERWSYNNIMYMVASHVIATYSGQPYTSFVEERIFGPLGMTSSTFSPAKAEASGNFTQGWTKKGRRVPEPFTEDMVVTSAGPGGVISNAADMAKWISTWISEGVHDNQTIIPPSVYRNVSYSYSLTASHPTNPEYSIAGYGMGWGRYSYRGHNVVSHAGGIPGLSTLVIFLPDDEIGVALFANGESQTSPLMLIWEHILDSTFHLGSSLVPMSTPTPNAAMESNVLDSTLFLAAFAGTYTNPGYGSFMLCSPSSESSYCAKVQSDFAVVDSVQGDQSPAGDLLAEWPRMWSSHVRIRHQQDSVFEIFFTFLYPNGYGKDTTPFETREIGTTEALVEFVIEDGEVVGFGMSGLVGELTERERTHETVRDRAEVWFDKI